MKKMLLALLGILLLTGAALADDVYVNPYYKSNGTRVEGYHRSSPNNTRLDNYSTKGNMNPYTGQSGTVEPFRMPSMEPLRQPSMNDYFRR